MFGIAILLILLQLCYAYCVAFSAYALYICQNVQYKEEHTENVMHCDVERVILCDVAMHLYCICSR